MKTNAVRLLDQAKVPYRLVDYEAALARPAGSPQAEV